jgi:hypothetical protein
LALRQGGNDLSNITDFLDEIERLAYKILLWVLLIPKTLLKIILQPNWVPGYVKEEINSDSKRVFDRYLSPVVLFLIVTLIPSVLFAFVPITGMTISQPQAITEDDPRSIAFTVKGNFRSSTQRLFHRVWWEVWHVNYEDRAGNPVNIEYGIDVDLDRSIVYFDEEGNKIEDPKLSFVYGELHKEGEWVRPFSRSDSGQIILSNESLYPNEINLLDNHTIEDYFYYPFTKGEYQVRTTIENYDLKTRNPIETFADTIYITVPADVSKQIYFDSATMLYGEDTTATNTSSGLDWEGFKNGLESGQTYLLALGILSLPLLFSFGTKVLGEDGVSETSLKESFYMQCYYFSPLTATFWASFYTVILYTPDIPAYMNIYLLSGVMFILIMIWFWNAETYAIMVERGIPKGKAWAVLFVLVFVLLVGVFLALLITIDIDALRRYSISLYPVIGAAIFIVYLFMRRNERLKNQQKPVESQSQA